jgi:hypothetical protein
MGKKTRRRKCKLTISEKRYKTLVNKKRSRKKMSLKDNKQIEDALYVKYCRCLKKFQSPREIRGYPICMNSVYKKRGFKSPKNAARKCKLVFK